MATTITILDQNDKLDLQEQIDEIYIKGAGGITNLYNKDDPDELASTAILNDGSTMSMNYVNTSGYIPVEYGKTYTFPLAPEIYGWSATGYVNAYNANKERVALLSAPLSGKLITLTITNAKVAYVRVTVGTTTTYNPYRRSIYMFVEGMEYPADPANNYIAYGESVGGSEAEFNGDIPLAQKHIDQVLDQVEKSPLHGKKVVFTGDSICDASTDEAQKEGWAGRIGTKHEMNWRNKAVSGGTITNLSGKFCISETDFLVDGETPDYIIMEGGTNDADYIGKGTDGVMPANFGSHNWSYGDFTTDTFCGAVESMFKRVTTDYPNAKVGFIIPQKMGYYVGADNPSNSRNYGETNVRRMYFDTIIELCKKWGIPYIDLWYGCPLNPMNTVHRVGPDPFYYNSDGQHLTAKGYDYITPMIEKWMETL